jgi:hypothetical protein
MIAETVNVGIDMNQMILDVGLAIGEILWPIILMSLAFYAISQGYRYLIVYLGMEDGELSREEYESFLIENGIDNTYENSDYYTPIEKNGNIIGYENNDNGKRHYSRRRKRGDKEIIEKF